MADTYNLSGSFTSVPASGSPSGSSSASVPLSETLTLDAKMDSSIDLAADGDIAVPFGGVVNANVVFLYASNKVDAKITTADGATQVVPVDPLFQLISNSVPVTAIKLSRIAGTDTTVQFFLGEKA